MRRAPSPAGFVKSSCCHPDYHHHIAIHVRRNCIPATVGHGDLAAACGAAILCNRTPEIVGNNSTASSAAPINAAATSEFITFALTPISVMTTMIESDGTAEASA